jgi:adenylate kinase
VRDLARFVKKVAETKPEQQYIFAVDRTQDRRQRSIIEGISKGMGSGIIEQNESPLKVPMFALKKSSYNEEKIVESEWTNVLQFDIKLRPSSLVVKTDEEGKEEELEFDWHCKEGLASCIGKVAKEYCEVNNLKPIKIYVNGPPLSGKTTLAKELAKKYNILHITIKDIERQMLTLPADDWLHEEIAEFRKAHPKDPFPKELLCEGFRRILKLNACLFRGYVLDGFPRSYSEAKCLFYCILLLF